MTNGPVSYCNCAPDAFRMSDTPGWCATCGNPVNTRGLVLLNGPRSSQAPREHARDLVPAFSDADPLAPSAGAVRLAFRAHVLWVNAAGFGCVHWQQLPAVVGDDRDRIKLSLCEVYARAYFESCFAAHFDGTDPKSDIHLLRAIGEMYGARLAEEVHAAVAACGPVRQEKRKQ